jgi:hypothetical protein
VLLLGCSLMAKKPDPRNIRPADPPQPIIKSPPLSKPAGKRPKTDAERLDDVLKRTGPSELDDGGRTLGKKHE